MENKRIPRKDEIIRGNYTLIDWKMINDFANLTKDYNPIHTNIDYIDTETLYSQIISHGLIGVSLICALLGNTYKGIILKNMMIDFVKPVLINTEIKPIIKCLSVKSVNKIYKNIEISFYVDIRDKKEDVYLLGRVIMFMWGEKI